MTDPRSTTSDKQPGPAWSPQWTEQGGDLLMAALGLAETELRTDPDIRGATARLSEAEVLTMRCAMMAAISSFKDLLMRTGWLHKESGRPVPSWVLAAAQVTTGAYRAAGLLPDEDPE